MVAEIRKTRPLQRPIFDVKVNASYVPHCRNCQYALHCRSVPQHPEYPRQWDAHETSFEVDNGANKLIADLWVGSTTYGKDQGCPSYKISDLLLQRLDDCDRELLDAFKAQQEIDREFAQQRDRDSFWEYLDRIDRAQAAFDEALSRLH